MDAPRPVVGCDPPCVTLPVPWVGQPSAEAGSSRTISRIAAHSWGVGRGGCAGAHLWHLPFGGGAMYLATLTAENFRIFGARSSPEDAGDALELDLAPGVTVLLGENDAGKTAVVDAVRLCLLTTAADFYRVTKDDFHVGSGGRARTSSRSPVASRSSRRRSREFSSSI
ncbi:AAA family ATPase [Streptomyces sp. NPDC056169]|uniref:AAA family ATPase n=1 Tax=Streptomyces sp. NPDC056169 TaxID=3345734 RepID=UPI0035DA8241